MFAHCVDLLIVFPLGMTIIAGIGALAYTERLFGIHKMFMWLRERDAWVLILGFYGLFFVYYAISKILVGKTLGSLLFRKQGRTPLPLP